MRPARVVRGRAGSPPAGASTAVGMAAWSRGSGALGRWTGVLVVALTAAAVVLPAVGVSDTLINLRIELLLWAAAAPYLLVAWVLPALAGVPSAGRSAAPGPAGRVAAAVHRLALTPVDIAFLVLAVATTATLLYAPLVLGEAAGPRDASEVVKLALYWTAFRTALLAGARTGVCRATLTAVLVAGSASAALALVQYFDASGVARSTAGWWAAAHHLRSLERDGRAFGTVGNPNYFGAMMALLAVVALHLRAAGRDEAARWAVLAALVACPVGVVLSGSRGALAMLVVAVAVSSAPLLLSRETKPALSAGAILGLAFVICVALVQAFPQGREDYVTRVAGALSPTGDSAFALRLERWRGALAGSEEPAAPPAPAAARRATGRPPADAAARARDDRRRADLDALVAAVRRHRATTGVLPSGPGLDVLVPAYLAALPLDPSSGRPYGYERTTAGFTVSAALEDPADPDFPLLAQGDARNYLENGDLERADDGTAEGFRALSGTAYGIAADAALFGERGIIFRGNPDSPAERAAVYQQRALDRAGGEPLTAAVWVMLPATVRGGPELYVNVFYADGERQDPAARVAADGKLIGVWQRLTATVTLDPGRRVDFVGVYLLSDDFEGVAYADGFQLVDGSVPVALAGLPEAGRSAAGGLDVGAQLRRSPLLGTGPHKDERAGTLDNEYLLVLARYGVAGLVAYLALWGALIAVGVRAARRGNTAALSLVGAVAGLLVFNLVAGSLYHLQLMAVFWPLAGVILAPAGTRSDSGPADGTAAGEPSDAGRPVGREQLGPSAPAPAFGEDPSR